MVGTYKEFMMMFILIQSLIGNTNLLYYQDFGLDHLISIQTTFPCAVCLCNKTNASDIARYKSFGRIYNLKVIMTY